jgi:predicted permease
MDLVKPLSPVIPVFLLVALGFAFAHWEKITQEEKIRQKKK